MVTQQTIGDSIISQAYDKFPSKTNLKNDSQYQFALDSTSIVTSLKNYTIHGIRSHSKAERTKTESEEKMKTQKHPLTFIQQLARLYCIQYSLYMCETNCNLVLLDRNETTCYAVGYGNNAPNDCYWGAWIITVQTMFGLFLDSITLGIIFARISHPKNRGRTIGISDSAVIARRDGILKLMFRIADFRETQVCPVCAFVSSPNSTCFRLTYMISNRLSRLNIEDLILGTIKWTISASMIIRWRMSMCQDTNLVAHELCCIANFSLTRWSLHLDSEHGVSPRNC